MKALQCNAKIRKEFKSQASHSMNEAKHIVNDATYFNNNGNELLPGLQMIIPACQLACAPSCKTVPALYIKAHLTFVST